MPSFTGSGDWAKDDVGFSVGETLADPGAGAVKGVEGKQRPSPLWNGGMEATDGVRTCTCNLATPISAATSADVTEAGAGLNWESEFPFCFLYGCPLPSHLDLEWPIEGAGDNKQDSPDTRLEYHELHGNRPRDKCSNFPTILSFLEIISSMRCKNSHQAVSSIFPYPPACRCSCYEGIATGTYICMCTIQMHARYIHTHTWPHKTYTTHPLVVNPFRLEKMSM